LRKLQQYYIFKITTSKLKRKNYNFNLSITEARHSGELVSIGDSQMLRSLREIKGQTVNNELILNLVLEKRRIKKKRSSEENALRLLEIEKELDSILFVPEIISVLVEDTKHYEYIGKNGFTINGVKYKRLLCGAGQARRNNSLWISEDYEVALKYLLNNNRKDIEIVPAKYSAYFSLASSASLEVSTPYFCVVNDLEINRVERVDFIEEVENADDLVIEKDMEIPFNLWDGQGIISPKQAKLWADELELDYVPSTFIIRSNFIKGMVAVIDFHRFSDEIGEHFITDAWGNKVNIRDMDVILTQSQFKLWNAYDSMEEYQKNARKNHLTWSVTRVSPKKENRYCFLNYQFVQALNLNDEQMKKLCSKTVDFFAKVTRKEIDYTLLYLLGKNAEEFDPDIFDHLHDNVTKALILNNHLIQDPYVKNHLVHSLNKKIKESYIGNLIVDGQYTMMVADPYAFMEHIFDLPITGLLYRNEHYNSYWFKKGYNKIAAMRAPLTWRSEVNILNLKSNSKTEEWYQHLDNCLIYNVFGLDNLIHGGSDEDGDIVCITNNQQVIEGAYGGLPIHYDTKKAKKVKIDDSKLWESDINGFNSKVGFVTNCATSAFALLPLFPEDSPEYKETIDRLKRFRKEQGSTIDAAKGLLIKPFPIHWTKWKKATTTDPEEIARVEFLNRIVINKRPLFMRHVYSHYNRNFLNFKKRYNKESRMRFNKDIDVLLDEYYSGKELSELENKVVSNYFRYSPFIHSKCLMNELCKYMEITVKELKIDLKNESTEENVRILKNNAITTDKEILKQLFDLYRRYKEEKKNFLSLKDDADSTKNRTIEQFNKYIRQEAFKISSNGSELANIAVDICYILKPSDNKSFVWNIFGEEIVENIETNRQGRIVVPFQNPKGNIEYLGEYYSLFEIEIKDEDYYESI
jgi:hypothetical protein